jgi:hypothetical protein
LSKLKDESLKIKQFIWSQIKWKDLKNSKSAKLIMKKWKI